MSARAALLAIAMLTAPAALSQAASTDPIKEAGRTNARLAMEYLKREQLQVAQDKIEKALVQNPKDVNVQLAAGLVYERLHENRTAEKHFRQAVKISPDSPEAQNALGAYFCRNNQQEKGEEMFLKAAANPLYRTPFVAYTNAGVCARSAGNLEQAERYLRQALTSKVDYPETYAQLAGVLHGRGNNLHARAFVERFLAVAPATPEMLLLGYNIEVAMKDEAAAAAFKARLEKEFPDSEQLRRVQGAPARTSG
ncbi:MAG TPA: type IV pilus biogenesis/stability protein PilW [Steroidobacteraceae bacterium]|nr:type IV pilus biogenesis/stability protein PilW [Steroidobacteraceae bacterium]